MSTAALSLIFDPLCGWCYAVHPALRALQKAFGLPLQFLPSGLFSGEGARPMSAAFRDMAWEQDLRIAKLTGQVFSESYYRQVLGDFSRPFDSTVPSLAFHLLEQAAPGQGIELLHRLQRLRNVEGVNTGDPQNLLALAGEFGLDEATFLSGFQPGSAARAQLQARMQEAQTLMHRLQARGVPELVLWQGSRMYPVPKTLLYGQEQALLAWVGLRL